MFFSISKPSILYFSFDCCLIIFDHFFPIIIIKSSRFRLCCREMRNHKILVSVEFKKIMLFLIFILYLIQICSHDYFQSGSFNQDMIPTVGFNMRKITKGNVTIKVWDIGGQPRFRSMWERYCRGVNAIV